ncbi:hypothetical protein H310_05646 [Aphanomyces invadans]|uniref:GOLD domain-containing protein n=1 Tax=Aphanomyces invadans TaxID=157072 RepID=A0A024UAJ8_9STRA|nr:hypothetical protein H310_05646 [Aphanomyces invadans]ETW03250.1 hypothetical protein H310_05646 [Aphanomyces invadans]|eukprot:XP_008868634.1 hypothetical protein H310_05646 [Aphanomyces invadans]
MNVVATSISGTNVQLVVSSLTDQSQVVCIDRPYSALEKLHIFLVKKHGAINIPSFPLFPSNATDAKLAVLCAELTAYFKCDKVYESDEVRSLVDEEITAGAAHMTAIDFILQPFEYEKVNILRGSKHELQLQMTSAGQSLVWKFEVEDYDIEFYAEFHTPFPMYTEIFHAATKYQTTSKPVEGMYTCSRPGVVTLRWDNTYSRLRNKSLLYLAHVVDKNMMESALAAADALNQAMEAGPTSGNCLRLQKSPLLKTTAGTPRLPIMPSLEQLTPQWLMDGLMQTTSATASYAAKLFGSRHPPLALAMSSEEPDACGNSLIQELNDLNMKLLQRVERLEDSLARIAVERDQALSRVQLAAAKAEADAGALNDVIVKLQTQHDEIERLCRERQNWPAVLAERDALLLEKHRWAMIDEFDSYSEKPSSPREDRPVKDPHLKDDVRQALEKELGQAELTLLRVRAQLGYSLHHHVPVRSAGDRLERLANELAAAKTEYDEKAEQRALEIAELNQQIVKYKSHKKVLVTELRNLKRETDGQVAVAMAEACEARMVNQSLKRQNELLLTQMRAMVDDNNAAAKSADIEPTASPLISTITAADIALLNGQPEVKMLSQVPHEQPNPYRERLLRFFQEHDPSQIDQVDDMLESYRGVEDSLMDSLHLKYTFQHLA